MTLSPNLHRYRWYLALGVCVLLALGALALRWWIGPRVTAELVVRRDFVQTIVATGHVETPNRVDIGAQITGTVVRVPVAEGQTVRAGALLVELEAAELQATDRSADVGVLQAREKLRQLREVQQPVAEQAVRQARVNLDNARAQLQRNRELYEKGFIGAAALDDATKAVELADAQLRTSQKQLDTVRPGGSDFALAEVGLAQARANADATSARLRYARIAAPADGTLIGRNVEVGDVVQPGKVLMTLSPVGRTQLVVDIDEKNLRLLAVGQPALASADAYPQERFAAELVYINPGVNAQTGAVEVKLDVRAPPPTLRQDMTVSVDIEVARRPNALLVAAAAVHEPDSKSPWVLAVDNGRAMRRPITLGLRSAGFVEVLDGLREGDRVIPAAAGVRAGAHVRLVTPPAAS